jgi:hypothetical protein
MRPHEPDDLREHQPTTRRRAYSLFFFQHDGGRSYLRFTLLGVIVFALLIVVPVVAVNLQIFY